MFELAVSDVIVEEFVPNYAPDAETARQQITRNQLKRMYPAVAEIDSLDSALLSLILDRTMHAMLHLDTVFSMNSSYDQDYFDQMKEQAIAYGEWLESPDGTPVPEILRYKSSIVSEGITIPEPIIAVAPIVTEPTVTVEPETKTVRKRSTGVNSAFQKAKLIYNEDIANQKTRAYTLDRCVTELGMDRVTANVYYSKFKHPKP